MIKKLIFSLLASLALSAIADPILVTATPANGKLLLQWSGQLPPYKVQRSVDGKVWKDASYHIYTTTATVVLEPTAPTVFFRVRTVADHIAPFAPEGLTGEALNCTNLHLAWRSPSVECDDIPWCGDNPGGTGLREYRIYRDGHLVQIVPATTHSVVEASLEDYANYSYQVSAFDKAGNESPRSGALVLRTPGCPGSTKGSITIAWNPNPVEELISGYIVVWGIASRDYTYQFNVGNVLTATISNLLVNVTHYFAVLAYNANGDVSAPSNEINYTP